MSEWELPRVDWKHAIDDIVLEYGFPPEVATIVESVANSIDAHANQIEINVDDGNYTIVDDGEGMASDEELREYHGLAITRKIKGQGIGFAGQGSKVYLKIAERIVTETRSDGYHRATEWKWQGNEPLFRFMDPPGMLQHRGTAVFLELKGYDKKITQELVRKTLWRHYNVVLSGLIKTKILLNGTQVPPWTPMKERHRYEKDIHVGRKIVAPIMFILADEPLDEDFQGLNIVCFGKAVKRNEFFNVPTTLQGYITGWIIANPLIEIAKPSKTDFRTDERLWRKFKLKASQEFAHWLSKFEKPMEPPLEERQKELDKLMKDVVKILREIPELADVFGGVASRKTMIPSEEGSLNAEESPGSQKTEGTIGGLGVGEGVLVEGAEEGNALVQKDDGRRHGDIHERVIRSGPKVTENAYPNKSEEVWLEGGTVVINSAHPVWKKSDKLLLPYHRLRCVVSVLIQHSGLQNRALEIEGKFFGAWGRM